MIYDVVVVGAGLAGIRCALGLRRRGFDGRITIISAEAHDPYDRPPLSKKVLAGTQDPTSLCPGGLAALDVQIRRSANARSLRAQRREVELSTGDVVPYDRLVIASGANARHFPGAVPMKGVFTLRTADDSHAIRAAAETAGSIVVVGGGVLGCEVAATLSGRGVPVTLVEPRDSLLARTLGDSQIARGGRHAPTGGRVAAVGDRCARVGR